jgi:hypothetical protein
MEQGGQPGGAMERDQGGWLRSGMMEMLAVGSPGRCGERRGSVAERGRSGATVIFSGEWRQHVMVRACR